MLYLPVLEAVSNFTCNKVTKVEVRIIHTLEEKTNETEAVFNSWLLPRAAMPGEH